MTEEIRIIHSCLEAHTRVCQLHTGELTTHRFGVDSRAIFAELSICTLFCCVGFLQTQNKQRTESIFSLI